MSLTKQEIDALVDGVQPYGKGGFASVVTLQGQTIDRGHLRRELYYAAGLTAEGAEKPERVRCYLYEYPNGDAEFKAGYFPTACSRVTPGWFVPDGAE